MVETLASRVQYVSYKLGNRADLLVPIASGTISGSVTAVTLNNGGENYQVGDIVFPTGNTGFGALFVVLTVSLSGAILSLGILQQGQQYTTVLATILGGGNGTGGVCSMTLGAFAYPSRIDIWLRDAYINLVMENLFPETEATISFNTVQGVGTYNFPETVRAIEALTLYRTDGTVITVETKDMKYIRRMNSQNQGAPSIWCEYQNTIQFRPVPDNNGPYNCVLDVWMKPLILSPISTTPIKMPLDWLEALDYQAAVRGHTDLQEEDKAHADQSLLYGFVDQTGKYTPGLIQNLQNRRQASSPFKDWGVQPQAKTQTYTRRR